MNFERFLSQLPGSPSPAFTVCQYIRHSLLPDEVRQAANRGLRIFPVSLLAKLTNPDLLIDEATSEISCLEELAAEYGLSEWRIVVDPALCVLRTDGQRAKDFVAALSQDSQEQCRTLQAYRGDTVWAFFRRPKCLVLRASARKLAPGVSILSEPV